MKRTWEITCTNLHGDYFLYDPGPLLDLGLFRHVIGNEDWDPTMEFINFLQLISPLEECFRIILKL